MATPLIEQAVAFFPNGGGVVAAPIVYWSDEPLQDVLIKRSCARRQVRQLASDQGRAIDTIHMSEARTIPAESIRHNFYPGEFK